ncbi:MAG: hypothetical protein ACK5SE_14765 [Pseudanabaena sp.]|jgi:hypothetical protein
MVNNKEIILPLLNFPHKDIFYFIQIIQRKKDHKGETLGGSNNNSRLIKAYYINSIDKLEKQWEEMIKLAEVFDARVSINLNPRNYNKAGFALLVKLSNQFSNGVFNKAHKAYNSVLGDYHSEIDKRWIVDIDEKDIPLIDTIKNWIINRQGELEDHEKASRYKILSTIPSKSGFHIITNPFNLQYWNNDGFGHIEIHKNNPTNLYIP